MNVSGFLPALELECEVDFFAWHSLPDNPEVHQHRFLLAVRIKKKRQAGQDRLLHLPEFKKILESWITPLQDQVLNQCRALSASIHDRPTLENLMTYFSELCSQNEPLGSCWVQIRLELYEPTGYFWGRILLNRENGGHT